MLANAKGSPLSVFFGTEIFSENKNFYFQFFDVLRQNPLNCDKKVVNFESVPLFGDSGRFGKNMAADVSAKTWRRTFQQKHGGGRFGKKNMPKRLRLKTLAETFRMLCGAYPVYARSPSPSQRPAPTTIASRSPFPLGLRSCSTSLSKMGI